MKKKAGEVFKYLIITALILGILGSLLIYGGLWAFLTWLF